MASDPVATTALARFNIDDILNNSRSAIFDSDDKYEQATDILFFKVRLTFAVDVRD
jgi:hypothetical protein